MSMTAPRELDYAEWMEVAEEEYRRIDVLLGQLADDDWAAPTDCDAWTVRDVVAHLAGGEEAAASIRETVRQAWRGRSLPGMVVDRMNAVQVRERAALTDQQRRADLVRAARRGLARRRSLPALARTVRLPFGPPIGVRPLGYLMGRIYTRDAWMHRIDLGRATGRSPELTPEHDGAVVADVVAEWAATHGAEYTLTLSGPAGGSWGTDHPGERLTLDAVEFCRLLSGRATGDGLLATPVPF